MTFKLQLKAHEITPKGINKLGSLRADHWTRHANSMTFRLEVKAQDIPP